LLEDLSLKNKEEKRMGTSGTVTEAARGAKGSARGTGGGKRIEKFMTQFAIDPASLPCKEEQVDCGGELKSGQIAVERRERQFKSHVGKKEKKKQDGFLFLVNY